MKKNNIGLTEEEVNSLLYGESIYDDNDNEVWLWEKEKIVDYDLEKSVVTKKITILEVATGKRYCAELDESQWYMQEEANHEVDWEEIKVRKKKI